MININQLNHTAIHVVDVERSVAFYRDVLQLEQIERPNLGFRIVLWHTRLVGGYRHLE